MRKANKLQRKGDDDGLRAMGMSEAAIAGLKKPDFAGRTGFPDYELSNNNAEIGRIRKRLEKLAAEAAKPGPAPSAQDGQRDADRALFQSVIDGTAADMLAPELADQLEAAYNRSAADPELLALFEQAVTAYQAAMMASTTNLA